MVFYGTILAMKLTQILDFRGAKYPFIILSMVLNVAWALIFFSLMDIMMQRYGDAMQGVDTSLMLGIFLGSLSIGFLMTLFTKDRRGATYGIYGGIAGLVVIVLMTWRSGLLAPLVGFMAIFGGINGGTLGEMYQQLQRKKK